MISNINVLIGVLWFASAIVDYSDFCYVWQWKDYRLDRMRDFMSTQRGKDFWRKYSLLWRSLIVIVVFFWPINNILTIKYFLIALFSFELIKNGYFFFKHKLPHPVFTKKAMLLIAVSLFVEAGLFAIMKDWSVPFLLMILRFFILSFVSILFLLPTRLAKKYIIKKAGKKIAKNKDLIVIGVTGSYGKTSVKTFLSHILSKKFKVIKTPKNINTETGIAFFILKNNFSDVDIFVVEMGAYRIGEIKMICDMVKPKIGILTAISDQHLALFGDIKQTQSAKYELLHSIPKDGLSVVNADNPLCREYLDDLDSEVLTFGLDEEQKPTCLIKDVQSTKDGLSCSNLIKGETINIKTALVGAHNVMNLAPCILVANYLGMSMQEIIEQSKTLEAPDKTLKIYKYGKSTIIDDSYNANYHGFCSALDVLSTFPSELERVVITNGIPELGSKSREIHEKIGGEIAYVADILVVVNKDFIKPLEKGVGEKYNTKVLFIDNANELVSFVKKFKDKETVILIESRVMPSVYEEIISNKNES